MNVYCTHPDVVPYGSGGFLDCKKCKKGWYAQDPSPFVVIGVTSKADLDRYPFTLIDGKWEKL